MLFGFIYLLKKDKRANKELIKEKTFNGAARLLLKKREQTKQAEMNSLCWKVNEWSGCAERAGPQP